MTAMASLLTVQALAHKIKEAAGALGFSVTGITSAAPLLEDLAALRDWIGAGFAADMDYMVRRPDLKGQPKELVPYAGSVISLAVNYYTPSPRFEHLNRYGRVARYAWGRDYESSSAVRSFAMAMLRAWSKSPKLSFVQTRPRNSSLLTTSPGRSRRISSSFIGCCCTRILIPDLRTSPDWRETS